MVSTQALTLGITWSIMMILNIINTIVIKEFSVFTVIGNVLFFFVIAFWVFDTNCLTEGGCEIWAWIHTILWIILPIIMIVILLFSILSGGGKKIEASGVAAAVPSVPPPSSQATAVAVPAPPSVPPPSSQATATASAPPTNSLATPQMITAFAA